MAKDLDWYFSRFKDCDCDGEDEDAFITGYLGACITIIRHHIFWDKIPDVDRFARETLKALIEFIKSENSEPVREPQKIMRDFIIKRIDQYINTQLRMICLAVHDHDLEAEKALREYQSVILGYIDRYIRIHQDGYYIEDHVDLSEKIINEWVRLAQCNRLSKNKNLIAFLTQNMKWRIMDGIKRVKTGRKNFENDGGLFLSNDDSSKPCYIEKKMMDIEAKLKDNKDPSDKEFT